MYTYLEGNEYIGTIEEVEIETKTKVTPRQDITRTSRDKDGRRVLPKGISHPEKFETRVLDRHHKYNFL